MGSHRGLPRELRFGGVVVEHDRVLAGVEPVLSGVGVLDRRRGLLVGHRPHDDRAIRIAQYFRYYGQLGFTMQIPFLLEAAAYDLSLLVLGLAGFVLGSLLFFSPPSRVLLCWTVAANGAFLAFFGILQKLTWNGQFFWIAWSLFKVKVP